MTIRTSHSRVLTTTFLLLAALAASRATADAAPTIKVMTYNTHHGGTVASPATTDSQLDTIAAQNPDVVVLQEAYSTQFNYYVNGLNARMGTTAWHGSYAKQCKAGTEPNCTTYSSESVMVLTRLTTVAVTPRLMWAKDNYFVARAAIRMSVALPDGTQANVFGCHLPALSSGRESRITYVNTFNAWAQTFSGPKLAGGDFNDSPGTAPILALTQVFADAWVLGGGIGKGYTHMQNGSLTPTSRIDYWFSDKAGQTAISAVSVVGDPTHSDHLGVVATYSFSTPAPAGPLPAPTETTLMHDGFDAFDATLWPTRVITGTQDSTVPVAVSGGTLRIGDLKASLGGTHYNGISSTAYSLSNDGCASVQLATSPNLSTTSFAMFALVRDTNNLYRWYQSGNELVVEKKIKGVKTAVANLQYDPGAHQFLRIRKVANAATGTQDAVFETAPDNGGVPGTFSERYREVWDASVSATSLKFELKAGTSVPEIAPGSAYWDNFHAAVNCK